MHDTNDLFLTRRAVCAGGAGALGVYLFGALLKRTTLVPGLSPGNEQDAASTRKTYTRQQMYEGLFFDRYGTALQVPAEAPGQTAMLIDPLPYRLIGYNSPRYGQSGLRKELYQYLYSKPGRDKRGANVRLTLDDTLQRTAYDAVCRGQYGASAIILDADTGELLCCTGSQFSADVEYDVNTYDTNAELYLAQDNKRNCMSDHPAFTCSTLPGSTSKLISAAAMLRSGAPMLYEDTTGSFEGVSNYNRQILGQLDLTAALEKSSNVYFAAGITAIGQDAILDELERFGYNMVIPLDNGTLLTPKASCRDSAEARQLAIGQGPIEGCSLFNAILYSALCSGSLAVPHLIKRITSSDGELLAAEEETPQIISSPLADESIRVPLRSALQGCAAKYQLQRDGWNIMAKTGTAEVTGWNNSIHLCLAAEAPSGKRYAIALNRQNTEQSSSALLGPAAEVLDQLIARSALLESEE